jgi:hypothetical protein
VSGWMSVGVLWCKRRRCCEEALQRKPQGGHIIARDLADKQQPAATSVARRSASSPVCAPKGSMIAWMTECTCLLLM